LPIGQGRLLVEFGFLAKREEGDLSERLQNIFEREGERECAWEGGRR